MNAFRHEHSSLWHIVLLVYFVCLFLLASRYIVTGSTIGGDAVYYFMNLRSIVMDRDFNFQNEYDYFHHSVSEFTGNPKISQIPEQSPKTGRMPNKYPIGTALLLIPFFVIAHIASYSLSLIGFAVDTQGYGGIYQFVSAFGSMSWGLLGCYLIFRTGKIFFDDRSALIGSLTLLFATPLIYYLTMEPMMSHAISATLVSALILVWLEGRDDWNLKTFILLGIIGGFMTIVRYQDATFLLLPLIDFWMTSFRETDRDFSLTQLLLRTVLCVSLFLPPILLQACVNNYLYGGLIQTGYEQEGFIYWSSPNIIHTLFSKESGLFLWAPIYVVFVIGFNFSNRIPMRLKRIMVLGFLIQLYLIASWSSPSQGDSFGNRMFLNCSIIFALGIMGFLDRCFQSHKPAVQSLAWGLVLGSITLNGILAALYCFRIIGNPY